MLRFFVDLTEGEKCGSKDAVPIKRKKTEAEPRFWPGPVGGLKQQCVRLSTNQGHQAESSVTYVLRPKTFERLTPKVKASYVSQHSIC